MAKELKNLLVHHLHDRSLQALAGRYLGGSLLDIGCGTKPYAGLLAAHVKGHVGLDHPETPHGRSRIDLLASAYRVPVRDGAFDSVLCTAVLEHLEEPEAALRECHRVLKEGGVALYSVPFIWHIHEEPRDFFRYTIHGLRYLFQKAGFEVVELKPLSGFWATFGQMLVYNLYRFNKGPLRWLGLIHALGLLVQGVAYVLDRLDRTERWTWMYHVVARKPFRNGDRSPQG